jgi:hypothetical protein
MIGTSVKTRALRGIVSPSAHVPCSSPRASRGEIFSGGASGESHSSVHALSSKLPAKLRLAARPSSFGVSDIQSRQFSELADCARVLPSGGAVGRDVARRRGRDRRGHLDSLPHNGTVVTLLAVCGSKHRESYRDIVMTAIVGPIVALVAGIGLGSGLGSF